MSEKSLREQLVGAWTLNSYVERDVETGVEAIRSARMSSLRVDSKERIMTTDFSSTKPETLTGFIGKQFIYTYDNGWRYEMYVKNAKTIDYRIHHGMVGGRWVKGQEAHIVLLADGVYKLSWDDPTGTTVSVSVNLPERLLHGVIFFPNWIEEDPKKTVCFQNEHLDLMRQYRDAGPTYPKLVIDEFATITFLGDSGPDREDVIDRAPDQLPADYATRTN